MRRQRKCGFFLHNLALADLSWTSLACGHSVVIVPPHGLLMFWGSQLSCNAEMETHTTLSSLSHILLEPHVICPS